MNLYHTISNELLISKTKQIPLKKFTTIMMFGIDRYVYLVKSVSKAKFVTQKLILFNEGGHRKVDVGIFAEKNFKNTESVHFAMMAQLR